MGGSLERLYEHLAWANGQVLDRWEQGPAPSAEALRLLGHLLQAEAVWLERIQGTYDGAGPWIDLDLEQCRALARASSEGFRQILEGADGEALEEVIPYRTSKGVALEDTLGDILLHVALHGAHHRGQIALLMRREGLEPASIDFILFARKPPEPKPETHRHPWVDGDDRMPTPGCAIREAHPGEYQALGQLMVQVYSRLEGFPGPGEQPHYYEMLANLGALALKPRTKLLVAIAQGRIQGGVVYFSDMAQYGSGGSATRELNASGFRLLAVDPGARGLGVGRALMEHCIALAMGDKNGQVIIHTTDAMQVAWKMYADRGFQRSPDLDFLQGELQVYGFRLPLGSFREPAGA